MDEIVYIVFDTTSIPEIVAITDNIYEILLFIQRHHTNKVDIYYLYNEISEARIDVQELDKFFPGILIRQKHLNYDYIDNEVIF